MRILRRAIGGVQSPLNFLGEDFREERLLKESEVSHFIEEVDRLLLAVSAHDQHPGSRSDRLETVVGFLSGEGGHVEVEQDQIDFLLAGLKNLKPLEPISSDQDVVPRAFEDFRGDALNRFLVIDNQDQTSPLGSWLERRLFQFLRRSLLRNRKQDREDRPLANHAMHADAAMVSADDAEHRRKE